MADDDQERSEQASAKRRQDFREKGQVAQSKEVNTALLLTASLLLWVFYAPSFWRHSEQMFTTMLSFGEAFEVTPLFVMNLTWAVSRELGFLLAPVFVLTLIIGGLASFVQVGPLFTTKPLQPDLSKLDPIKGMQKFISVRSAVELVKSLAKVILVGVVAYRTVRGELEGAFDLSFQELPQMISFLGKTSFLILAKTSLILIVLAFVDFFFSRWEMEKKMRMTKQEQKEEFKETEGDPHVKSRIRSIQMQAARKRMMAEVPKADVVITNPTHLSVALAYRRDEMGAPQIVAKGSDHLAMRIREIAGEHDVPLVENKPVARALYQLDVGEEVPEELFRAVAEILAYVYSLKGNSAGVRK